MEEVGEKNPNADLATLGLEGLKKAYWNLSAEELTKKSVDLGQGKIANSGALVIHTGEFTGRSPKDRFIVKDNKTLYTVNWGNINIPFDPSHFDALYNKVVNFLNDKEVYVRDSYACADSAYRLNIRVITQYPWQNLFANNLFMRPSDEEIKTIEPDWVIINAPEFKADPKVDHTRQHNFAIINFTEKVILIGGTGYTGEIKKGIFSVLNYILPQEKNVLSMHCSANIGKDGDTAIFFGLSGTGKTTLSADPDRKLIGDDEHGWSDNTIFNFEGGCYAKCINLSQKNEPQIYNAIKLGALLENVKFLNGSDVVDYSDVSITENTRVAYPIHHINNIAQPSLGHHPKNIFFLTYDAFGILPPISKLNSGQAMYHFISGYTSKVAGTEAGITEPNPTFSACFGAPFMPLHPTKYAEMLGKRMKENNVNVWLVNTGLSGGPYGIGERLKLSYTRALIKAALKGNLDKVEYEEHPVFGLAIPKSCPGVPTSILNPKKTWKDKNAYDNKARDLANAFIKNFEQFAEQANSDIMKASPKVRVSTNA